jgi:hypothetical protein
MSFQWTTITRPSRVARHDNKKEWEGKVGILMVRCPRTGQDFPSGIETDSSSFERTPAFSGTIRCPICGVDHPWSKIDTWLAETDASPSRAA